MLIVVNYVLQKYTKQNTISSGRLIPFYYGSERGSKL